MTDHAKQGRASRAKGAEFEREVIRLFRARGWKDAARSSDGRKQIDRGDIVNGPDGCHFECKRQERLNVPKAFDQVMADAGPRVPILIHRPSRHETMATLPLEKLLHLLAEREWNS